MKHDIYVNDPTNDIESYIKIRLGTSDENIVEEIWHQDIYHVRPEHIEGGLVVDIGANIGVFSVWCLAAGAAEVVAYEPFLENYEMLKANLNNGESDRATLHRKAVTGEFGYYSDSGNSDRGSIAFVKDPDGGTESVAFRDVLNQGKEIAFLKMDIEGGEYDCFNSITTEDLASVRRIGMEIHGPAMDESLRDGFKENFGNLVSVIADWGHVDILGKPSVGGMIFGIRY